MPVHVTEVEVQQWVQNSRLTITGVDPTLESSAFSRVASALSLRYDTTTWLDDETTPSLVRSIISMLMGAWIINRAAGEASNETDSYGLHLESSALTLLGGLTDGSITLDDAPGAASSATGSPAFWPTDLATTIALDEGNDAEGAAGRMFSIGQAF